MLRSSFGSLAIVFGCAWACSSSSSNTTEEVCKPATTQQCEGNACTGIQTCLDNGKGWTPCNCSATGGTGGADGGSLGGSAGSATGGSSGTGVGGGAGAGSGGVAGGTDRCSGDCAQKIVCCEETNKQGIPVLRSLLVTLGACDGCNADCVTVCQNNMPSLVTLISCENCIAGADAGAAGEFEKDCTEQSTCVKFQNCVGEACW